MEINQHHEEIPEWHPGLPVPDGFKVYDGNGEDGPCEPRLEPIEFEHCETCDAEQEVVGHLTVGPFHDPTAAYRLACGHLVI